MSSLVFSAVLLTGCHFGSAHDELLIGPYHLSAGKVLEEMHVCYALTNGDSVGRIDGTVFAVGWNDRFIVAKQHPRTNRKITNFYILDISRDSTYADPSVCVTGPLSAAEFDGMQTKLHLPAFTRVFTSLE